MPILANYYVLNEIYSIVAKIVQKNFLNIFYSKKLMIQIPRSQICIEKSIAQVRSAVLYPHKSKFSSQAHDI